MHMNIGGSDLLIIGLYFLIVFSIGLYFARRGRTSTEYFLAGRNVGWFAIGASLFATNISSEHFIGLAGSGAATGLAVGHFEWLACFMVLILGWVFVPFYLRSRVFTMPEFLEIRYGPASRWYLTSVSLLAYVLTKISVTLFAGSLLLNQILGWDIYTSSIVLVIATGLYTIAGGLSAVIYTELIQTFVLIGGAVVLDSHRPRPHRRYRRAASGRSRGLLAYVQARQRPRFPLDRHHLRCADSRHLVLVHGPVHRPARAVGKESASGPRGNHLCGLFEDPARFHPRAPRHHRPCPLSRYRRRSGLSRSGHAPLTRGPARHRHCQSARRADVLARCRLQQQFHPLHHRHLQKIAAQCHRASARATWAASPPSPSSFSACCGCR